MILRLLLIFWLSSLGSSTEVEIDRERCAQDTACYIRESCLKPKEGESAKGEKNLVRYNGEDLIDDICDFFMQIRPFTDFELQIKVQVNSSTEPIDAVGVALIHGTQAVPNEEQFRCIDGDEKTQNGELEITPYGDPRRWETKSIFCSILLKTKKGEAGNMFPAYFRFYEQPKIVFTIGSSPQSIEYHKSKSNFWNDVLTRKSCDPYTIITSASVDESHITEEVDSTRSSITCPKFGRIKIVHSDQRVDYPETLLCVSDYWSFERVKAGGVKETVTVAKADITEKITVQCVTRMCSLCPKMADLSPCVGCKPVIFSDTGDCASATCTDNKWKINGDKTVVGEMECRRRYGASNKKEAAWYFSDLSFAAEITTASCEKKVDCFELAQFARREDVTGADVLYSDADRTTIYCPKKHKLFYYSDGKRYETANMTCSQLTGMYEDSDKKAVPHKSTPFCELQEDEPTTVVPAAAFVFPTSAIAGLSVLGALLLLGACAGGCFVLVRKRQRRYNEYVKAQKAAEAAAAVAYDRKNLAKEYKTEWELRRRRKRDDWVTPDEELLKEWTNKQFMTRIIPHFHTFSPAGQMGVLMNLTAFEAYSLKNIDLECVKEDAGFLGKENGTLKQFFLLWRQGCVDMLDCVPTWEFMWRFMRILYESFIPHDDHREVGKRMVKLVVSWARPMLTELTFKMRDNEDEIDSSLRLLAVRMLLWAEAPDVIAELARQAELPFEQLENPMRCVVLQYAVRHLGRAEAIKAKYWDLVVEDNTLFSRCGTIRQHIIFALCCARDETKKDTEAEYKMLKEVMAAVFDYTKNSLAFSPRDQMWAMRGASEYVSNMRLAVDLFNASVTTEPEIYLERLMDFRCKSDKDLIYKMREQWRLQIIDLVNASAEMCIIPAQFLQMQGSTGPLMMYTTNPPDEPIVPLALFDVIRYQQRSANVTTLVCDRNVTNYFHKAIGSVV